MHGTELWCFEHFILLWQYIVFLRNTYTWKQSSFKLKDCVSKNMWLLYVTLFLNLGENWLIVEPFRSNAVGFIDAPENFTHIALAGAFPCIYWLLRKHNLWLLSYRGLSSCFCFAFVCPLLPVSTPSSLDFFIQPLVTFPCSKLLPWRYGWDIHWDIQPLYSLSL